ncbi:Protein of uncharacterised function (DUF3264) [Chromobacterium violaceum]|nr:hypothetical protein CV_1232 [Chromobacterium violaceum ATCC 12472]SUX88919.1 Protein of uncharacterised function (DUF3264) [Chromobacterium violaceum]
MGFNPRARVGRDGILGAQYLEAWLFQSTRPRWARLDQMAVIGAAAAFQSTRPRWARLSASTSCMLYTQFQSTRPRWARPPVLARGTNSTMFQSTRPRWARRGQGGSPGRSVHVSIHAPVLGATRNRVQGITKLSVSIHAPALGATCCASVMSWGRQFQSTRPRWARRHGIQARRRRVEFQSTRPRWARRTVPSSIKE